jgi:ABC-type nitrate/sulfonate/bicarbonate transport system permease component
VPLSVRGEHGVRRFSAATAQGAVLVGTSNEVRRRFRAATAKRGVPFLLQVLGFCIAVGVWQLVATGNSLIVPTPGAVVTDIHNNFVNSVYLQAHGLGQGTGYWYDLVYTARNVLIGVSLGTVVGVTLGLISVPIPIVSQVLNPIAATFGAAPIFVAAPFFLVWFGIVSTAQVTVVSFYTALLMYIFSRRAAENIPVEYLESASSLGAKPLRVFRSIYMPGTVPELIGGFRIALAGAWGLEAIAELLGAQNGIGFLINYYSEVVVIPGMVSLTLLLGCVAVVCDGLVVLGFRKLTPWTSSGRVV